MLVGGRVGVAVGATVDVVVGAMVGVIVGAIVAVGSDVGDGGSGLGGEGVSPQAARSRTLQSSSQI